MRIILASNNRDKLREVREILKPLGLEVISQREAGCRIEAEETGETFVENARIKARAAMELTGEPCVADDSGLEVNAMGGAPGVYSSRYCGDDSYADTCRKIINIVNCSDDRGARFRCAVVCCFPNGDEIVCQGTVEGTVGTELEGENGFGYDPLFVPEGCAHSMACLTDEEKNAISHRGRAFRQFAKELAEYMENKKDISEEREDADK